MNYEQPTREVDIFSVTTDGFLTTATHQQMVDATDGVLCRYYKSSRRVLSDSETIFEVKHVIQQPLDGEQEGKQHYNHQQKMIGEPQRTLRKGESG